MSFSVQAPFQGGCARLALLYAGVNFGIGGMRLEPAQQIVSLAAVAACDKGHSVQQWHKLAGSRIVLVVKTQGGVSAVVRLPSLVASN